jgi:hypothetical protein
MNRPGVVCGSEIAWADVVRTRRAWLRGLFEKIYCLGQGIFEFRSKPGYDNRCAKVFQSPRVSFASFLTVRKEGGEGLSLQRNEASYKELLS